MRSAPAILLLLSCAEKKEPPPPPVIEEPLEIKVFSSSRENIDRCDTVQIEWNVSGAEVVNIELNGTTLVSSLDRIGSVVPPPICRTATFELMARKGPERISRSLTLTPEPEMPFISYFEAIPRILVVGGEVAINWETQHAERVRIDRNGVTVATIETSIDDLLGETLGFYTQGSASATVDSATTTFSLTAINGELTSERQYVVYADEIGIDRFTLRPPGAVSPTMVEVHWETFGGPTQLLYQGIDVPGFPGTSSGTISLWMEPGFDLTLVVKGQNSETWEASYLPYAQYEEEGNDTIETAIQLGSPAVFGGFSGPEDVDFYLLFIPASAVLEIWTEEAPGSCGALNPRLTLYDAAGEFLEESSDPCASILEEADAGTYYLAVSNATGELGTYLVYFAVE